MVNRWGKEATQLCFVWREWMTFDVEFARFGARCKELSRLPGVWMVRFITPLSRYPRFPRLGTSRRRDRYLMRGSPSVERGFMRQYRDGSADYALPLLTVEVTSNMRTLLTVCQRMLHLSSYLLHRLPEEIYLRLGRGYTYIHTRDALMNVEMVKHFLYDNPQWPVMVHSVSHHLTSVHVLVWKRQRLSAPLQRSMQY